MAIAIWQFPPTNLRDEHYVQYFSILISTMAAICLIILVGGFFIRQIKRWKKRDTTNQESVLQQQQP